MELNIKNLQIKKILNNGSTNLIKMDESIYLLIIPKSESLSPIGIKKISDRIQYADLPSFHDNQKFVRISLSQIKNYNYQSPKPDWYKDLDTIQYFYYCPKKLLHDIINTSENKTLKIKILNNKYITIYNNKFAHIINIENIIANAIWQNINIKTQIKKELILAAIRLGFYANLFAELKNYYRQETFYLLQHKLYFKTSNIYQVINYQTLTEDIYYLGFEKNIKNYLDNFSIWQLDNKSGFPTVTIRSKFYLKARPDVLSHQQNGYVLCCAREQLGKQTPINSRDIKNNFSLWLSRSCRYLDQHAYRARVIYDDEASKNVITLIGEQITSIALFPALIKGALESLNCNKPENSVRLIAHNEDILSIAYKNASLNAISNNNKKAKTLYKMVCPEGSDALKLFKFITLPSHGAGIFSFKTVPKSFFELTDAAKNKESLPPGHNYYLLGLAYQCIYENGLAVEQYQKALRLDNNDPDILNALGSVLLESGLNNEATIFLKQAFELIPDDPELATSLGQSYLACGQIKEALEIFEKAVKLCPASAKYLTNLGQSYFAVKRNQDALNILNKAIKCDPELAEAHAIIAQIYLANNEKELAKKHALFAYRSNPLDSNIANLLWSLTR